MKYDLFISDFDGTLGSAPDLVEKENIEAIKKYVEKGGIFAIITGRLNSSIRPICLKYGLKGLVISYQGAMIKDIETDKTIFMGGIKYDLAGEVIKDFLSENAQTIVEMEDKLVYTERSEYIKYYEEAVGVDGEFTCDLVKYVLDKKRDVQKINVVGTREKCAELTEKFRKKYKDRLIFNNGSYRIVEAINPKCSKGEAVRFLAKYYNIPHEKIITVGDSTNDIELISGDWHGVAVGDAREELKAIADEVTVPFKENPVKFLLEKYCL